MDPFFYFLPGVQITEFQAGNSQQVLADAGLEYLGLKTFSCDAADASAEAATIPIRSKDSPAGCPGLMIVPLRPSPPNQAKYLKTSQTWRKVTDKFWIGRTNDRPPTSAQLIKPDSSVGFDFQDGKQGWQWYVPLISAKQNTIEKDIEFDETTGALKHVPTVGTEHLMDMGLELAKHWLTNELTLDLQTLADYAIQILSYHYRVSLVEFNELRAAKTPVFDNDFVQAVTSMAIGNEIVEQLQKKTNKENDTDQPGQ